MSISPKFPLAPELEGQILSLSLSKNSVFNTIVSSPDHDIMYEVSSTKMFSQGGMTTTICRLDRSSSEKVFAGQIAWKPLQPLVRIGWQNCEWMPVRDWLVKGKEGMSSARTFMGAGGAKFRWKRRKLRFHLTHANDSDAPGSRPSIAIFYQAKRGKFFRITKPAHLDISISPSALRSLDHIIVSFLVMEKRARDG